MKLTIQNAIIEVTRRCNMECEHCLRGDAENIDMSDEYLDTFFSKVQHISSLTITGGEPSLAVDRIQSVIRHANLHNTSIGSFYMATNAKVVTAEFLKTIIDLYVTCEEKEMCCIHYSSDDFHDMIPMINIQSLEAFSFCEAKGSIEDRYVISEGRGHNFGSGRYISPDHYETYDEEISEGMVYLNCEGNIIAGCDFSYESQREQENIVCHVNDMTLESFIEFGRRELDEEEAA